MSCELAIRATFWKFLLVSNTVLCYNKLMLITKEFRAEKMKKSNKLIVPLDLPELKDAVELVDKLSEYVDWFKIGNQLFTASGPLAIKAVKERGKRVFLDLKFHDIPNTVARVSEVVTSLGVDMFNVHASGGFEMMNQAVKSVISCSADLGISKPVMLGVTVLTSINETQLHNELGISKKLQAQVVHLAKLSKKAGLDGVVASPMEIQIIRETVGDGFVIVTPGVRPTWSSKNDQKRVMTPGEAISAGADMIVVGRPIRNAPEPDKAAIAIIEEIEQN